MQGFISKISLIFILLLSLRLIAQEAEPISIKVSCKNLLRSDMTSQVMSIDDAHASIDGILITGGNETNLESILKHLRISNFDLRQWREMHYFVVSVGEGFSNLIPHFKNSNIRTLGLDIWYDYKMDFPQTKIGQRMSDYLRKNYLNLRKSNATHLRLSDESTDILVSHLLINNMHIADTLDFISEVIRVLRPGGEARLYGTSKKKIQAIREFIKENFSNEFRNFQFYDGLCIYKKRFRVYFPEYLIYNYKSHVIYDDGDLSGPQSRPSLIFQKPNDFWKLMDNE